MLKKTLCIAGALISITLAASAQARDNYHDDRGNRHSRKTIIVEQHIQYNNRHESHNSRRYDNHDRYASRNDRRYDRDEHREHYVYYPELHLLNHIIVALANR